MPTPWKLSPAGNSWQHPPCQPVTVNQSRAGLHPFKTNMNRSFFGRWIPIRNRSIFGGPSCTVPQWFGCISPLNPTIILWCQFGSNHPRIHLEPKQVQLDWNTKIWYANLCRDNAKVFEATRSCFKRVTSVTLCSFEERKPSMDGHKLQWPHMANFGESTLGQY